MRLIPEDSHSDSLEGYGQLAKILEEAEAHVWLYLDREGLDTRVISTGGTLDGLLNNGWSAYQIADGLADELIKGLIVWL